MSSSNWSIVGHEWAVQLLQSSLDNDRLPHAILIAGDSQVGKRTLALALASAVNCERDERPCGRCRSCTKIAHGTHPDVRLVAAESGERSREGQLKIEQMRDVQRFASLAPMESPFKVIILREFERATLPAANALLKTLEEPPSQVRLILTSARPDALLPTIVSRCQTIQLRPVPLGQIKEALVDRWLASPKQADLLARLSQGRIGWAVERLTDSAAWDDRERRLQEAQRLPNQGAVDRLAYADALSRKASDLQPTLATWTSWWRDVLLAQHGCSGHVTNVDVAAEIDEAARHYAPGDVRAFLARLEQAPEQLNRNVNSRLLLETLLLHMPVPAA
ncbi:MAG: DNA polymerase III subunit delta' [Caldilineales bacterium]